MRTLISLVVVFAISSGSPAFTAPVAQLSQSVWPEGTTPGVLNVQGTAPGKALTVSARLISRLGMPISIWQSSITAGTSLQLPPNPFSTAGFYELEIGNADGTDGSVKVTAAVIAKPLQRVSGVPLFGVNTHFAQRNIPDSAYGIIRLANVDLIRDEWTWMQVERSRGTLQAPPSPSGGLAHQRQMLLSSGLRILHNCAYGNKAYDTGGFPTSPEGIAAFAKFCGFVAQQLGPALYGSEIWNESNKIDAALLYAPLVKASAEVLKQVAPSAEILEGGGAGPGGGADPIYEETVYNTIGPSCCTGHSVHPYMTNPDVGYIALKARLNNPVNGQYIVNMESVLFWLDYLDHTFEKVKSSHITEIGWASVNDGKDGVNDEKQAAFISRTLIHATKPSACTLDSGVQSAVIARRCSPIATASQPDLKSIFIYDFQNDGVVATNHEQNFGLVHNDLTPKMSYSAYAEAAGLLRGATFYKAFKFDKASLANVYLYRLGAHDSLLVMWTSEYLPGGPVRSPGDLAYQHDGRTQTNITLSGTGQQTDFICTEWDGHSCTVDHGTLAIGNLPVFVRLHSTADGVQVSEQRP